jgi:hypothetical protein
MGFRATPEERASIRAAAEKAGFTASSYIRAQALKKPTTRAVRRPPVETAQLAQLLGLIGVAGSELRRIAQTLPEGTLPPASEITAAIVELREAARVIMRLMGKRIHDH